MRPELEPLPSRMLNLPLDGRGYPVPWFVDWIDGKPEFRAMDGGKWIRAIRYHLCWVCGGVMGKFKTFVAGPMCGINRTSSEPPNHLECAQWSARNCPFLNNPEMTRREKGGIEHMDLKSVGGFGITRNPGVTMLWTCKDFMVWTPPSGGRLIQMGEAEHVEWYKCGKLATREDVLASIDSGYPALVAVAATEKGAMEFLVKTRETFEAKWLPA